MHHKYAWSIDEMELMYPFEFDIYAALLTQWLEEEKRREEERR
jgi:hypothetical protein